MRSKRPQRALPRLFRQLRVLIIGCGDVGLRITRNHASACRIIGTVRSPEAARKVRQAGGKPLNADLDDPVVNNRLAGLATRIIYLLPPDNQHDQDIRLRRVLASLDRRRVATSTRLAYCGTTGVYGNAAGKILSEASPINPYSTRARRRADAERQLRRAQARPATARLKVCRLRAPGIYAQDRLPASRLHKGLPALQRDQDSYSSHIHADDLGAALWTAVLRGANGRVYNACDGQQQLMGDYFDQVADHLNLPRPPRLSAQAIQREVSPMMWSFMRESRRLSNHRLLGELRLRLRYPTVAATLTAMTAAEIEQARRSG